MKYSVAIRRHRAPYLFRLLLLLILILSSMISIPVISAQDAGVTVSASVSTTGIPTLVGPDGRTLYTFAHDESGESACYDQCAEAWPPLTIGEGAEPAAGAGVPGQLGTVQRQDGTFQVTYNGWPLYYFVNDAAPGDANGQGLRDVWFAANPATVMVMQKEGLGEMLVGPGGMTLYVFLKDEVHDGQGESYCYEECAVAWPPLIVPEGVEPMAGDGITGTLGITERTDGSRQVTYNGWPLYFFKRDRQPGDITGNAVKDVWYVAMNEPSDFAQTMSVNLELVAEGLTTPIALVSANDGSGRLFVADQGGTIHILSADGQLMETPFLDIRDKLVEFMPDYDERGLLGLAFHPDYANNGRFFIYYTAPPGPETPAGWDHVNVVAEYAVSPDNPDQANPDSERIILAMDQPQFNHNAGQITFGPDGYLYIPIGDGGGGNDVGEGHTPGIGNGQDTTNLHGSILRIDVNGEQPYAIPADNPFAAPDDNVADEIYAYGLRNPFRISFDSSGQLFVSDAGQELYEEVSIVTAGGNYGWFIKEGTHCFDPANPTVPPATCAETGANGEALIDPIIEYDHRKGLVVVGGSVYEGSAVPELAGYYIFASYSFTQMPPDGRLFAAQPGEGGLWPITELTVASGEEGRLGAYILSFGEDDNGELYVLTSERMSPQGTTGKVWRLGGAEAAAMAEAAPEPSAATGESEVTVSAAYSNEGIPTLVGTDGRTLYTFAFDDEGASTCYGPCAEEWPPLLIADGAQPAAGEGAVGQLGTVARDDGSMQVTYNGWPLYYYHEDAAPGEANGQGEADVWFAANPGAIMLSNMGNFLVGPGGMTLYIFTEDHANESYCYEECAVAWPPLVVPPGVQPLPGMGVSGELGLTERADGLMQVTYNGWPMYFFKVDEKPGDTTGDGVKEVWFVATLDREAPAAEEEEGEAETETEGTSEEATPTVTEEP